MPDERISPRVICGWAGARGAAADAFWRRRVLSGSPNPQTAPAALSRALRPQTKDRPEAASLEL
jgi:hypothetical protein